MSGTVVVKYCGGNTKSVLFALKRLGVNGVLSDDRATIEQADRVIFPGVGQARATMEQLRSTGLSQTIAQLQQPVLGVCLGLHLLCEASDEGEVDCLGIIPGRITRFNAQIQKVPHIGWSRVYGLETPLFEGVEPGAYLYFVHSYRLPSSQFEIGWCSYGEKFSAALKFKNFYAVQFHPEKSGEVGQQILRNFLKL